jgi:hypothetical protein
MKATTHHNRNRLKGCKVGDVRTVVESQAQHFSLNKKMMLCN